MKYIKIIFINLLILLYSTETLLILFLPTPPVVTSEVIKERKIQAAIKKQLPYDTRTRKEVFISLKKENNNLMPVFNFAPPFRFSKIFQSSLKEKKLIPFRGPINSISLTCAEDLQYKTVKNDKYGFKNLNKVYKKKINTVLLGDSFAAGLCQDNENDITGNLISLAVISEFGKLFSPKNIVYSYYEGNDLEGLEWEKRIPVLMEYFNDENFNVDYINRYDEIKNFLDLIAKESLEFIYKKEKLQISNQNNFKDGVIDFFELKKTKKIFRNNILKKKDEDYDLDLLIKSIIKIKNKTHLLNSNFVFVYVPVSNRYIDKIDPYKGKKNYKESIIKEIKKRKIKVIDLTRYLDSIQNPEKLYALGEFNGHFNAEGYKRISEIIIKELKN